MKTFTGIQVQLVSRVFGCSLLYFLLGLIIIFEVRGFVVLPRDSLLIISQVEHLLEGSSLRQKAPMRCNLRKGGTAHSLRVDILEADWKTGINLSAAALEEGRDPCNANPLSALLPQLFPSCFSTYTPYRAYQTHHTYQTVKQTSMLKIFP